MFMPLFGCRVNTLQLFVGGTFVCAQRFEGQLPKEAIAI
jgi:hypothetical protein